MADWTTPEQTPDAVEEINRLKEENLRLRDLLIGKDAELGTLRGQLTVYEERSRRLNQLIGLLQRLPGVTRVGGPTLRRMRRRKNQ